MVQDADEVARPKLADYAAVAVAPVLIFVMISSLANYFVMLFYSGGYGDRLWYLISMYTMGAVALGRIVIENDRSYSAGYAIALGGAMVFVMTRFAGQLPFSVGIVLLIGYLADRIVHDCTLIDYTVDASGEGLVDRAMDEANGIRKDDRDPEASETEKARRRRKSHQPGRTVFLLALAAFPLFGLGQFMLSSNSNAWSRAQLMLGLYLFASLSLLVTTSFLNLRRYLRQREVDMPTNVTVAWLAGGILMIAALMMTAFLAPMPGQALARLPAPKFLKTSETMAKAMGWGGEGADKSGADSDAETSRDDDASAKEKKGAGDNENEGSGETGGKKPSDKTAGSEKGQPSDSGSPSEANGNSDSKQQGSNSKSQNGKQQQTGANSKQPMESQENPSGDQGDQQQPAGDQASGQSEQGESSESDSSPDGQDGEKSPSDSGDSRSQSEPGDDTDGDPDESSESREQQDDANASQRDRQNASSQSQQRSQQSPESSSDLAQSLSSLFSALGGLVRLLLIFGLIAVVAYYVYRMRERLLAWWQSLFAKGDSGWEPDAEGPATEIAVPLKPFSSFRNPIGRENDPRRIILITCQAFDAWARERGVPRSQDETPSAYIERLRTIRAPGEVKSMVAPVEASCVRVGNAYDRIVFGRGVATQRDVQAAEEVWNHMNSFRSVPVGA
ncbi:MAG: DUF4129 domain-containing protein [Planctomycetota bacterium]